MATFDLAMRAEPRATTQLFVGATSPLWGYYGAMAAGGMAYWLMTRWTQPVDLKALLGGAVKVPATLVEAATELAQVDEFPAPVGGEAAPISPLVEALAPEPEPMIEPVVKAPAEPIVEAIAEAAAAPEPESAPEPPVIQPETPVVPVAALDAEPSVDPVSKPRVRKGPLTPDVPA